VRRRYELVGGSPLLRETQRQADALSAALGLPARIAMRLWRPSVPEALADVPPSTQVCLVPVAPFSIPVYEAAARRSLGEAESARRLVAVAPFGTHPALVAAWAEGVRAALVGAERPRVVLTAHSLPRAVVDAGDAYVRLFEQAAAAVMERLELSCVVAYQSQGASGGEWLGPTLDEELRRAAADGCASVVVAPIGFLTEHVETLYDLDIEAQARAAELGLELRRTPALGAHPGLITGLADAARAVVER
jgi:ferrochelatase